MTEFAVLELIFFCFSAIIIILLILGIILLLISVIRKSKHQYSSKEIYNFDVVSREEFEKYKAKQDIKMEELMHKLEKYYSHHNR